MISIFLELLSYVRKAVYVEIKLVNLQMNFSFDITAKGKGFLENHNLF